MTHTNYFFGKKMTITTIVVLGGASLLFSGCAAIFNKTPVVLYGHTSDLKVSENGVELKPELTYVGTKGIAGYKGATDYYGAGIYLKRSRQDHIITLERGGKKADITLKSKFAVGTMFLDLFTTGPLGIIIDIAAGPLRTAKPRYIDVRGELGEAPKKKEGELKKEFKKSFNKK